MTKFNILGAMAIESLYSSSMAKKTREAKPGELRGIRIIEILERLSKRPESRMDVQKLLDHLSLDGKTYAKHLVMSGPSSNTAAAKACGFSKEQLELAMQELETGIEKLLGR